MHIKMFWLIQSTSSAFVNPALVGRSETSGCIHLTNWDALKLSALVSPGLSVEVKG